MPTDEWFKDHRKVSAYISPDLSQHLDDWMKKQGIKKTTQGLIRILEEYLGVVQVEPIQPTVDGDRLENLEAKLADLAQRFEVMSAAIVAMKDAIASSPPATEGSLPVDQSSNSQLSILEEPQEEQVVQTEPSTSEIWTTKQLIDAGVSKTSARRWKDKGELPKNSKGYTIVAWAGKQPRKPFGDLWEVSKLPPAPES